MASSSLVDYSVGGLRCEVVDLTFDSSYPTNGEALTLTHIGNPVFGICNIISLGSADGAAIGAKYVPSTGKVIVYATTGEVANATDCTDLIVRVLVFGR